MEGGRERREGGREGGRGEERGREGGRERGREGERERGYDIHSFPHSAVVQHGAALHVELCIM